MPIASRADSVASALHLRLGATPRGRDQTIMTLRAGRSKAVLLTLHKTGTSHFALTLGSNSLDNGRGNLYREKPLVSKNASSAQRSSRGGHEQGGPR